jgi:hypothetical protein
MDGPEARIEKAGNKYARERGCSVHKGKSPAQRGVPDRMYSHINCGPFLVEYKAPGQTSTDQQIEVQNEMAAHGWRVYRDVDRVGMAKQIIDDEINGVPINQRQYKPISPL